MTREEKLQQFAEQNTKGLYLDRHNLIQMVKQGAEWADQHPHWIPVEERKPPIAYHDDLSENYLVVDSDGELLIAYYDAKNELWFSVDSNPKIYDVTHWMEIVPPRKEEKE